VGKIAEKAVTKNALLQTVFFWWFCPLGYH